VLGAERRDKGVDDLFVLILEVHTLEEVEVLDIVKFALAALDDDLVHLAHRVEVIADL